MKKLLMIVALLPGCETSYTGGGNLYTTDAGHADGTTSDAGSPYAWDPKSGTPKPAAACTVGKFRLTGAGQCEWCNPKKGSGGLQHDDCHYPELCTAKGCVGH